MNLHKPYKIVQYSYTIRSPDDEIGYNENSLRFVGAIELD